MTSNEENIDLNEIANLYTLLYESVDGEDSWDEIWYAYLKDKIKFLTNFGKGMLSRGGAYHNRHNGDCLFRVKLYLER